MPLGEFIAEITGQAVFEIGGEAIYNRFGWKGCLATLIAVAGLISGVIWYFT